MKKSERKGGVLEEDSFLLLQKVPEQLKGEVGVNPARVLKVKGWNPSSRRRSSPPCPVGLTHMHTHIRAPTQAHLKFPSQLLLQPCTLVPVRLHLTTLLPLSSVRSTEPHVLWKAPGLLD